MMLGLYRWKGMTHGSNVETKIAGSEIVIDESAVVEKLRGGVVPFYMLPDGKSADGKSGATGGHLATGYRAGGKGLSKRAKDFITQLVACGVDGVGSENLPVGIWEHKWIAKAVVPIVHAGGHNGRMRRHGTVVARLQAFRNLTPLQRAGMGAIVFSLPDAKLAELRAAFQDVDVDQSGVISRDEMMDYLRKREVDNTEMWEILAALDENDNGGIDYSEFMAAIVRPEVAMTDTNLRAAFDCMDQNSNGRIVKSDVENLIGNVGEFIEVLTDRERGVHRGV